MNDASIWGNSCSSFISYDSGYTANSSPTISHQNQFENSTLEIDFAEIDRISNAPILNKKEKLKIEKIKDDLEREYQEKQQLQNKGKHLQKPYLIENL
jgi:hypothetical protein